jgi:hypothetical protein
MRLCVCMYLRLPVSVCVSVCVRLCFVSLSFSSDGGQTVYNLLESTIKQHPRFCPRPSLKSLLAPVDHLASTNHTAAVGNVTAMLSLSPIHSQ